MCAKLHTGGVMVGEKRRKGVRGGATKSSAEGAEWERLCWRTGVRMAEVGRRRGMVWTGETEEPS
jgi:hypothetical protein